MEDPKVTEVLSYLVSLIREHKVAPNPTGWDEAGQFHSSHQAIRMCFRNNLNAAKAAKFEDYALAYYPFKSGTLRTALGCGGWAVTTMSRNPNEAWQAIKLLTNADSAIQELVVQGAGSPKIRHGVSRVLALPGFSGQECADWGARFRSIDADIDQLQPG